MAELSSNTINGKLVENGTKPRLDWVDFAKGFCIIMVVMFHSTKEIEDAVGHQGFLQYVVTFARPFRMPDFFLISGIFLARVINLDWRTYLDRKVVHFIYFYAIWIAIHLLVQLPDFMHHGGIAAVVYSYLEAFIQPLGTLWFIYQLPIFFVVAKLTRRVPPALIFVVASALEITHLNTGSIIIDQFASRFIYFYSGYWLAPKIFSLAAWVRAKPFLAVLSLIAWSFINGAIAFAGYASKPFISLPLGFAGAAAVVTIAVLLVNTTLGKPLRYCGKNSIVVYLSFFLPEHATKLLLLKSHLIPDVGMMSLITTAASVIGALLIWWSVRNTRLSFLFARPKRFYLDTSKPTAPYFLNWRVLGSRMLRGKWKLNKIKTEQPTPIEPQ